MSKAKVLFLCTGNSCRSQVADAFLRQLAGDRFDVFSAGVRPKGLNPDAVESMKDGHFAQPGHDPVGTVVNSFLRGASVELS